MKYTCLSIAGFDGSGGAGMQADLKVFSALGCYGMTALTALPIQNTCGVKKCYDIPTKAVSQQLETIFEDTIPDAIKIGMLFSSSIINVVSEFLKKHAVNIPIVLDPVMIAKSGDALLKKDAILTLKTKLLPLATLVTPNIPEAYSLLDLQFNNKEKIDIEILGKKLLTLDSKSVLLKGGHNNNNIKNCDDLLLEQNGSITYFKAERINSKNTHGTGCTLSAAICSLLALGFSLHDACKYAKKYLFFAMLASKNKSIGKGRGPVHHFYHLWPIIKDKNSLIKLIGD